MSVDRDEYEVAAGEAGDGAVGRQPEGREGHEELLLVGRLTAGYVSVRPGRFDGASRFRLA